MTVAFIAATSILLRNTTATSCDESFSHDEGSKTLSDGYLSVDNLYFQDTSSTSRALQLPIVTDHEIPQKFQRVLNYSLEIQINH